MKHNNLKRHVWFPTTTLGLLSLTLFTTSASLANDWMFAQSDYSHNPVTGQRLTQYASVAPIEGLPDPRETTSRYWNTRTQLRGANGSTDTVYEVRSIGDARGRDDARWERGFDAWKDAASIAGPFWAGAYWPGGTPGPGLDYQNQGYGTGYGYGGGVGVGGFGAVPYGFGGGFGYGGGAVGPYAGYGPNGYFGGPGVPFGVSPFGYGHAPYSAYGGGYPPYGGHRPHHPGHGGGGHNGGHSGGGHGGGGGNHGGGGGHSGGTGYNGGAG